MRVVKGKVVGNSVVLKEVVREESDVDVVLRGDADGWDLSEVLWAEIDASIGEADAAQLIPSEVVLAQLSNILK